MRRRVKCENCQRVFMREDGPNKPGCPDCGHEYAIYKGRRVGLCWTTGPRNETLAPASEANRRLQRALAGER